MEFEVGETVICEYTARVPAYHCEGANETVTDARREQGSNFMFYGERAVVISHDCEYGDTLVKFSSCGSVIQFGSQFFTRVPALQLLAETIDDV